MFSDKGTDILTLTGAAPPARQHQIALPCKQPGLHAWPSLRQPSDASGLTTVRGQASLSKKRGQINRASPITAPGVAEVRQVARCRARTSFASGHGGLRPGQSAAQSHLLQERFSHAAPAVVRIPALADIPCKAL